MTDEKEKQLAEKYPIILKNLHGDPSKTCMSDMHGGIACGDGWYELLDTLMGFCQFNTDKNCYPQLVAEQIKEKFGTLRFYYTLEDNPELEKLKETVNKPEYAERSPDYIRGAVSFAELMSGHICETCGKPGKRSSGKWLQTICTECEEKQQQSLAAKGK